MPQLQQLLSIGTKSPAVARTLLQADKILSHIKQTPAEKELALSVVGELMSQLAACAGIAAEFAKANEDAERSIVDGSFARNAQPHAVTLPSIVDVNSKAESFLQKARNALAC